LLVYKDLPAKNAWFGVEVPVPLTYTVTGVPVPAHAPAIVLHPCNGLVPESDLAYILNELNTTAGAGVTGAGVTGAGVTGAGVGGGVTGAGVTGAGVGGGVTGAGVTGAGVIGAGVIGAGVGAQVAVWLYEYHSDIESGLVEEGRDGLQGLIVTYPPFDAVSNDIKRVLVLPNSVLTILIEIGPLAGNAILYFIYLYINIS
jgi:hypothetical protein